MLRQLYFFVLKLKQFAKFLLIQIQKRQSKNRIHTNLFFNRISPQLKVFIRLSQLILSKMNCKVCQKQLNTQENIPVYYRKGSSMCIQCFKASKSQLPPMVNKPLLEEMKRQCCATHESQFNVYSITADKLYCQKCLMYKPEMKKAVLSEKLIEASEVQKLCLQVREQIDQCCQQIKKDIIDRNSNKMDIKIETIFSTAINKIEDQYEQALNNIKQARKNAEFNLIKDIEAIKIEDNDSEEIKQLQKFIKNRKNKKSSNLKYETTQLNQIKTLKQNGQKLREKTLEKLQTLLNEKYFNSQQQQSVIDCSIDFELSLSDISDNIEREEESLLDSLSLYTSEKLTSSRVRNQNTQWFKYQEDTQIGSNKSVVSDWSPSALSQSRISFCSPSFNKKHVLELKNLTLPRISSGIKEVRACNMNAGSVQAKRLIKQLNDTFVSKLDLSSNKLTSNFLLGLNKNEIGKYLKEIKLSGNNIDTKSESIKKKVQMLQKKGVKIIV